MDRRRFLATLGAGASLGVAGCVSRAAPAAAEAGLTLAATTTTHDSGLLGTLVPGFEERFETRVKPVIRGSGAALRTAADGDADAVLVHARPLEEEFIDAGHGVNRRAVMVNDFLVVGPDDDPAEAAGEDPLAAFRAIATAEVPFLSRGDRSGTHLRERELWERGRPRARRRVVPGDGPGHGQHAQRRPGARRLHAVGPRDLPRDPDG
ncbi:MAG: substrate-binding domain-containing protein [Halobacteriales archaeon]|nr:substrate-binding domain-containing protein [Halobacteriales archaeon]